MAAASYSYTFKSINQQLNAKLQNEQLENTVTNTVIYTDEDEDCPICLTNFNELKCDIVTCGCGYKVCLNCTQEHLLTSTQEPHCIHCKRAWNRTFQYNALTPKFINNKYKKVRKELLFEKEKAMLPDTQPYIERHKKLKQYEDSLTKLIEHENEMRARFYEATQARDEMVKTIKAIKNYENITFEKKEKRKFIKKCPSDGCRGFLSSNYKCELCEIYVCSKCFEIKGHNKNVEHTCNPDDVKSAQLIKSETKPCPSCSTPIFKISGCSQMWCTQCKVAFSWKSGKIETGRIHNPHYYDYMKTNTDTEGLRNPGEQLCGGLIHYNYLHRVLRNYKSNYENLYKKILVIHRAVTHHQYVNVDNLREKMAGNNNNLDLRIRYLNNEIDEKHFKKILAQRDNIREKNLSLLHIYELYLVVCTEQINGLYAKLSKLTSSKSDTIYKKGGHEMDNAYSQVLNIMSYCNDELMKVSKNYKMKVAIIDNTSFVIPSHRKIYY